MIAREAADDWAWDDRGVTWVFVLGVIVVVSALVVVAVMRGEQMRPAYDDRRDVVVPADRPLTADDLATVRFTTAVRGYRMSEVDALLARLRAELAEREREPVQRRSEDVTAPLRREGRHAG
ncbi:MAG: DivIVA domain-containing protein [Solirubrobacteraceae bacterium]